MALIKCKECGAQASTTATQCPACGAKAFKPTKRWHLVAAVIIAIAVVKCVSDSNDAAQSKPPTAAKTPEQLQADAAKEADFQDTVRKLKALKLAMKDPASFELIKAGKLSNGTLCVQYRSKNSFGANVVEQQAISQDGKLTPFDKACAGKSGEDVSHARTAM